MPDVRPDIREVYDMVTKQKPSDTGALERQRTRQIRTMRNRKVGAFALVAAIVVVAIAVILATRPGENRTISGHQGTPTPVEVASGFVEAYGAHDADRAIAYLADDADISRMMDTIGDQGIEGTPAELSILISWLDAAGNTLTLDACHETAGFVSGTTVSCTYDYYGLRADEIGFGPYRGSYLLLTVGDEGRITRAVQYWENKKFAGQMWEPFASWVSRNYAEDAAIMYQDGTQSAARPTQESIQLWRRHTIDYVQKVQQCFSSWVGSPVCEDVGQ